MSEGTQLQRLWAAYQNGSVEVVNGVLDEAQNAPPAGKSDGTVPPELFTRTREWVFATRAMINLRSRLENAFQKCFLKK